jgi:hypothetical protein
VEIVHLREDDGGGRGHHRRPLHPELGGPQGHEAHEDHHEEDQTDEDLHEH